MRIFKLLIIISLNLHLINSSKAKTQTDSLKKLQEVYIKGYLSEQIPFRIPSAAILLNTNTLQSQQSNSLIPALNQQPGVRFEERSPGSYRLSLRGSLLRSPFGIRNVKIYYDDLPLTDAGGNTYLNLLDAGSLNNIEILKGPDGSIFGANSGGVVIIRPDDENATDNLKANIQGGSYGLFYNQFGFTKKFKNAQLNFNQAYQTANNYRRHSDLEKLFFNASFLQKYAEKNQFKINAFYSDLGYQTPGGLTADQFNSDPQLARPASRTAPGPVEQQAGIYNKTLFGGITNTLNFSERFANVTSVFGSYTDFNNPFITNYEQRFEQTIGARFYFKLNSAKENNFSWQWFNGTELQQTKSDIKNFNNNLGTKTTLQSADDLNTFQYFFFSRYQANIGKKLITEAALSLNFYENSIKNPGQVIGLKPQLMPKIAFSYLLDPVLLARFTVSRGYSTPTLAEIRPSNQVINTSLRAENGYNYETGLRYQSKNNRFNVDVAFYYYGLNEAIVRRVDDNDDDFFVNAGSTNQYGLEFQTSGFLLDQPQAKFIKSIKTTANFTYNNFKFSNYIIDQNNFSGNKLTGVPPFVTGADVDLGFAGNSYINIQYLFTDELPLNDANAAYADAYHQLRLKAGVNILKRQRFGAILFAGADNLLNQQYSLGNDLNAFGGRYFNAAATRNYYFGCKINL